MPNTRKPGEFRLPEFKTPADIEASALLTDEEKAIALDNLTKMPPSDGYWMMGCDPELQAFWALIERAFIAFFDGDYQGVPFGTMNLITLTTALHTGSEYQYGVLAQFTAKNMQVFGVPAEDAVKLAMFCQPDSQIWNEEERMTLGFTVAVLDGTMTDELFEQARLTWGEKKLLRYIAWIGYVKMWSMLINALGMDFSPERMEVPPFPPVMVEKMTNAFAKMRPDLLEVWRNSPGVMDI